MSGWGERAAPPWVGAGLREMQLALRLAHHLWAERAALPLGLQLTGGLVLAVAFHRAPPAPQELGLDLSLAASPLSHSLTVAWPAFALAVAADWTRQARLASKAARLLIPGGGRGVVALSLGFAALPGLLLPILGLAWPGGDAARLLGPCLAGGLAAALGVWLARDTPCGWWAVTAILVALAWPPLASLGAWTPLPHLAALSTGIVNGQAGPDWAILSLWLVVPPLRHLVLAEVRR